MVFSPMVVRRSKGCRGVQPQVHQAMSLDAMRWCGDTDSDGSQALGLWVRARSESKVGPVPAF